MVERQYDLLRKEKLKGLEEQKTRQEEHATNGNSEPVTAPQATNAEDSQPMQQEVSKINLYSFVNN